MVILAKKRWRYCLARPKVRWNRRELALQTPGPRAAGTWGAGGTAPLIVLRWCYRMSHMVCNRGPRYGAKAPAALRVGAKNGPVAGALTLARGCYRMSDSKIELPGGNGRVIGDQAARAWVGGGRLGLPSRAVARRVVTADLHALKLRSPPCRVLSTRKGPLPTVVTLFPLFARSHP